MVKPVSGERERAMARLWRVNVLDTDTVAAHICGRREIIRLYGIDAPEVDQPLGEEASDFLRARLGYPIYARVKGYDRYDRLVAWIYQRDLRSRKWKCLNVELVRAGLAYAYRDYGGRQRHIIAAEREAKDARRGLWKAGAFGDEKPWDNRNASPGTRLINGLGRSVGNWVTRRIRIHG